jgi:hypothetical protein|tara:strand:- start:2089 stop:2448 length:360 start_codon:yes stop_codon:yes gene_type:complete
MPKNSKLGDCYEASAKFLMSKLMLDPSSTKYLLIHAEVAGQGELDGITYGHGFVLDTENDMVIDVSNGRNLSLPRAVYYAIGRIDYIDNIHEYTYEEMSKKTLEYRHWGPWDLETASGY